MLEVGLLFLAGSQKSGKLQEAPGRTMVYLWAFVLLAASACAEVDFKHHNNTELAAVLQQVHNRYVILRHFELYILYVTQIQVAFE